MVSRISGGATPLSVMALFPKAVRISPQDNFPCRKKENCSSGKNERGTAKFVKLKLKISGPYSNGA